MYTIVLGYGISEERKKSGRKREGRKEREVQSDNSRHLASFVCTHSPCTLPCRVRISGLLYSSMREYGTYAGCAHKRTSSVAWCGVVW